MNQRVYTSQKSIIIESAIKLVLENGPNAIKTDAVIKASGLSKGGFFYHFKTIDDLLFELAKKSWVDFLDIVESEAAKDSNPVGRFCRAYIKVSLGMTGIKKQNVALNQVFFAVISTNRNLIERLKKESDDIKIFYTSMAFNDGLQDEKVKLICMAADGFWLNEMIGLELMKKKEKAIFCDYLISLTEK